MWTLSLALSLLIACGDKDADSGATDEGIDTDTSDTDTSDTDTSDTDTDTDTDTDDTDTDDTDTDDTDTDDTDTDDTDTDGTTAPIDADGDGYVALADGGDDCDDGDATVHPDADELCDDIDQDCDGDLVGAFDDLDGDATPDCADDDPCAAAGDDLLIWFTGDDYTDLVGTTALDGTTPVGTGIIGDAWVLGGTTGMVAYDPDPWLVSPLSIEAWIQTTSSDSSQVIVSHYECGGECATMDRSSPSTYIFGVRTDGQLYLSIRDGDAPDGTGADLVAGETIVTDGDWHHVAAVLDPTAGTIAVYLDGTLDGSASLVENDGSGFAQDSIGDVDPITVGWQRAPSSGDPINPFQGSIDELSVYDGVLSAADVAAVHGAGIAGKCALD